MGQLVIGFVSSAAYNILPEILLMERGALSKVSRSKSFFLTSDRGAREKNPLAHPLREG
jgi:hypothetical protein